MRSFSDVDGTPEARKQCQLLMGFAISGKVVLCSGRDGFNPPCVAVLLGSLLSLKRAKRA